MARLQELLDEFARRNGIDALEPDDDGRFHVLVDDDVQVACFERFGQLCLVSELGPVPEPGPAGRAWLERLLRYALQRMKHDRGTPADGADGAAVLFARCALADISVGDFEGRLEDHVNALEGYRRALAGAAGPAPARLGPAVLRP